MTSSIHFVQMCVWLFTDLSVLIGPTFSTERVRVRRMSARLFLSLLSLRYAGMASMKVGFRELQLPGLGCSRARLDSLMRRDLEAAVLCHRMFMKISNEKCCVVWGASRIVLPLWRLVVPWWHCSAAPPAPCGNTHSRMTVDVLESFLTFATSSHGRSPPLSVATASRERDSALVPLENSCAAGQSTYGFLLFLGCQEWLYFCVLTLHHLLYSQGNFGFTTTEICPYVPLGFRCGILNAMRMCTVDALMFVNGHRVCAFALEVDRWTVTD